VPARASSMADVQLLQASGPGSTAISVRVQAVVLFNISDSFIRRPDGQARVIGTLLGVVGSDGVVDVRNSYVVPHSETADGVVAVDIDYHRTMLELSLRVNAKENVVGWYSTGRGVTGSDALIQDFFARECPTCVHLTVDPNLTVEKSVVKAYVGSSLTLADRQLASYFQDVPLDLRLVEAERVGIENLKKPLVDHIPTDLEGIEATLTRLQSMLETVSSYVDAVLDGRIAPDNTIGRYLADTVAAVPKFSQDVFDRLFNDSVQDQLLLLYLANLTRAQLAIAEKLNTAAQSM